MSKSIWMTLIGVTVAVLGAFTAIALIAKHRGCDSDEYEYDDMMMDDDLDCDYCKAAQTQEDDCSQEVQKTVEKANDAESTAPAGQAPSQEGFDFEDEEENENP